MRRGLYKEISVSMEGPIAWLTIERPEQLNTLKVSTLTEITQAVQHFERDDLVRAVVVTGSGDRAFSGGVFVDEMADMDAVGCQEFTPLESHAYHSMLVMQTPCIAAVNGYALGGGCVLAMAADSRVAADNAVFGLTDLNIGAPVPIEAALLPLLVGHGRAREIVYTARHVGSAETLAIGCSVGSSRNMSCTRMRSGWFSRSRATTHWRCAYRKTS